MITQRERNFYDTIKKWLPGDVSRIENSVDSGTPDVTGAYYNQDYWIELKAIENIRRKEPLKLLRDSQVVWHKRRAPRGSLIFVLVKQRDTIFLYVKRNLKEGYHFVYVLEKGNNTFDYIKLKEIIIYILKVYKNKSRKVVKCLEDLNEETRKLYR